MLAGEKQAFCQGCYYEDQHGKVSGRQRQLLKSAVTLDNFNKSFAASPHWSWFEHSDNNQGHTDNQPVDLQIDLGNTCNSSCIMCRPMYSSKVIDDYKKLHAVDPVTFMDPGRHPNWSNDDQLVDKFINELVLIPNIRYIHFVGGETLYMKSFYKICDRLIELGLSKDMHIGTTTNATVYDDKLEHVIRNFKHVHLGISVETFTSLNDYIRWPSTIRQVKLNLDKFLALREQTGLHLSLRITPNVFTIYELDTVFEYMIKHKIIAESSNILQDPTCLRIELIPDDIRQEAIVGIDRIINEYGLVEPDEVIVNRRNDNLIDPVIASVIFEYRNFLLSYQEPDDIEAERATMVRFIRGFESLRNNTILDYLPRYEEFLRSYGY
jgi:hypothetical protein